MAPWGVNVLWTKCIASTVHGSTGPRTVADITFPICCRAEFPTPSRTRPMVKWGLNRRFSRRNPNASIACSTSSCNPAKASMSPLTPDHSTLGWRSLGNTPREDNSKLNGVACLPTSPIASSTGSFQVDVDVAEELQRQVDALRVNPLDACWDLRLQPAHGFGQDRAALGGYE